MEDADGTAAPVAVFVVDDQSLVRAGFRMVIDAEPDMTVVGDAANGADAIAALARTPADVVVMDLRMPVMDGVAATRELAGMPGAPRVLVLTTFDTEADAFAALAAGACGFLPKTVPAEELVAAIRVVAAGDAVVAPHITRRLLDRFAGQLGSHHPGEVSLDGLTEREYEVWLLVARGRANAEIAGQLGVAEGTVKAHVSRLLTKLAVDNRVALAILAYEKGLIRPAG
jgi:DNA-binding NarL/FixJ family response regulator